MFESARGESCAGILEQSTGARNRVRIGLSYQPARLHRLADFWAPYNYLCTYDLYSPVHNVLDTCISITRASGTGSGPGNLEFFGPCEMASSR